MKKHSDTRTNQPICIRKHDSLLNFSRDRENNLRASEPPTCKNYQLKLRFKRNVFHLSRDFANNSDAYLSMIKYTVKAVFRCSTLQVGVKYEVTE
jgi:hypothetical protein